MTAGRELDALVAEKVMGLPKPIHEVFWFIRYPHVDGPLPAYSTDIAAAWEVVEKMKADHFDLCLEVEQSRTSARFELVGPAYDGGLGPAVPIVKSTGQVNGDNAPHVICRAALKAVGYEVPA
jgi:hypothetical protein